MTNAVPAELVTAAVRTARERGADVADVPLTAIASSARISRSTLLRRIGGSRRALDEAVRAAGFDAGGRPPVRERAIEAAARLIGERGLAAFTLDAVAVEADCSLPSLHAALGGRDGLLGAVFERYSPVLDLERLMADPPATLQETVHGIYHALITAATREPRVMPALMADLLGNPDGPARPVFEREFLPRLLGTVGAWLEGRMRAGELRPMPLPLIAHLLIGPLVVHVLSRPVLVPAWGPDFPSIEEACDVFATSFLRSVAVPRSSPDLVTGHPGAESPDE